MQSIIHSVTISGLNVLPIKVEVDMDENSHTSQFFIVGLPDASIKESRKRIVTALKNSGLRMPERRITVNLSPADLRKEGSLFDLPIAIGILQACGALNANLTLINETIIVGELSLDGTINPIKGSLLIAYDIDRLNKKKIILPYKNAAEASLIKNAEIIGCESLDDVIKFITNKKKINPTKSNIEKELSNDDLIDFDDVKGQDYAKRALQIAAAGRHNLIFSGPPGSGKTMLAKRLLTIMPEMSFDEIIDTTKIYSISGKLVDRNLITRRPFRNPHHSITRSALLGGGITAQVGEVSLAHNGILFLDELPEFRKDCIESLREPIENGKINISRLKQQITYPTNFLLICAYNPCPCGYFGDKIKECACSSTMIKNYQGKISGPILDRIDIRIGLKPIEYQEATSKKISTLMSSEKLKEGVNKALKKQHERFGSQNKTNSMMSSVEVERYCILTNEAEQIIKKAFIKLSLSMRSYHKVLKLAQTICDLSDNEKINVEHIAEALMYKFETQ